MEKESSLFVYYIQRVGNNEVITVVVVVNLEQVRLIDRIARR